MASVSALPAWAHRAIETVANSKDPKKAIRDAVGDLTDIEIAGEQVLLGIYFRPQKTAGGIIRPDSNVEEDTFQGKAGLVLKLGPNAFRNTETGELYEQRVNVNDWGVFKVGDAWSLNIRGYPCRLVRDTYLRMRVADPNIVF